MAIMITNSQYYEQMANILNEKSEGSKTFTPQEIANFIKEFMAWVP